MNPPHQLAEILRPYQVAGYHWLNYLNEVGWGGILADDMGLGKTIQALSCLQLYKDQHINMSALVVCPTTLMFNWENEIFISKIKEKIPKSIIREKSISLGKTRFSNFRLEHRKRKGLKKLTKLRYYKKRYK